MNNFQRDEPTTPSSSSPVLQKFLPNNIQRPVTETARSPSSRNQIITNLHFQRYIQRIFKHIFPDLELSKKALISMDCLVINVIKDFHEALKSQKRLKKYETLTVSSTRMYHAVVSASRSGSLCNGIWKKCVTDFGTKVIHKKIPLV